MFGRILVLVSIILVGAVAYGHAQSTPPNYDKLRKILEDKFAPPQSRAIQQPSNLDRRDFHWIAPKGAGQPNGVRGAAPRTNERSTSSATAVSAALSPPAGLLADNSRQSSTLVDAPSGGGASTSRPHQLILAQQEPDHSGAGQHAIEQAPVAKRNSYVIQLKPNANEKQIGHLLHKYHLNVTKTVPALGLLRVERNEPQTRSIEPMTEEGRQGLENILNPPIIKSLRKEPIIDSAVVETTLSTKSIPRAVKTQIQNGGVSYTWEWGQNTTTSSNNPTNLNASVPPVDGNWGLKSMHVPPVWTIIQRYRAANPNLTRPKLAFIDSGFSAHEDLSFNSMRTDDSADPPSPPLTSAVKPDCNLGHGDHVVGIAGATFGNDRGIDGIIPQAKIDAVPFTADFFIEDSETADVAWEQRTTLFIDAIDDLSTYLQGGSGNSDLHVINVSLGYNFIADRVFEGDPDKIPGLKSHIADQAKMFATLASLFEKSVLFVSAAGNDSAGLAAPIDTKWSSPISWAATQFTPARRPKNILVVEAVDRDGKRADFSNIGGHVSAPGVNILSTLGPSQNTYGVCSGTSQAAPHVAALATLLFELDPTKKPADIADIIKSSATKQDSGPGAPRVDALDAVLKLSQDNFTRLADLNGDGKVDAADLAIFARQMQAITDYRVSGKPFTEDLNGDGVVDDRECLWPMIDFNGSGAASLSSSDARMVLGAKRTDLQVMELAWTDKQKDFKTALREAGLDTATADANGPATPAASQSTSPCR